MKKYLSLIPALAVVFLLSSCFSLPAPSSKTVDAGDTAQDDRTYLTGKISYSFPDSIILPKEKRRGLELLLRNLEDQEKPPLCLKVPEGKTFFEKVPKGKYRLEKIYFTTIKEIFNKKKTRSYKQPQDNWLRVEGVTLDLTKTTMAYLGDFTLHFKENAFGYFTLQVSGNDEYTAAAQETADWLFDDAGEKIVPENMFSTFDSMEILDSPYPVQLLNYGYTTVGNEDFKALDGSSITLDPSKKIALLGADRSWGTYHLIGMMEKYMKSEYGVQAVSQEVIKRVLPEYPATLYEKEINSKTAKIGLHYTIEEEYNGSADPLFQQISEELKTDYLFVIYQVSGAHMKFDSSRAITQSSKLIMTFRGLLYESGKLKAAMVQTESSSSKKLKMPFPAKDSLAQAEKRLFEDLTKDFVDPLYNK